MLFTDTSDSCGLLVVPTLYKLCFLWLQSSYAGGDLMHLTVWKSSKALNKLQRAEKKILEIERLVALTVLNSDLQHFAPNEEKNFERFPDEVWRFRPGRPA